MQTNSLLRLMLHAQARRDDQAICNGPPAAHPKSGKRFLHVRVEDLEVNRYVKEKLASGESLFIDLKDVKMVDKKHS